MRRLKAPLKQPQPPATKPPTGPSAHPQSSCSKPAEPSKDACSSTRASEGDEPEQHGDSASTEAAKAQQAEYEQIQSAVAKRARFESNRANLGNFERAYPVELETVSIISSPSKVHSLPHMHATLVPFRCKYKHTTELILQCLFQEHGSVATDKTPSMLVQKAAPRRTHTPKANSGWNPKVDPEKPCTAEHSEDRMLCINASNVSHSGNSRATTPELPPSQKRDTESREQEVTRQMAAYERCFTAAQDLFDSHHSKRLRRLLDNMAARKAQAQVTSLFIPQSCSLSDSQLRNPAHFTAGGSSTLRATHPYTSTQGARVPTLSLCGQYSRCTPRSGCGRCNCCTCCSARHRTCTTPSCTQKLRQLPTPSRSQRVQIRFTALWAQLQRAATFRRYLEGF